MPISSVTMWPIQSGSAEYSKCARISVNTFSSRSLKVIRRGVRNCNLKRNSVPRLNGKKTKFYLSASGRLSNEVNAKSRPWDYLTLISIRPVSWCERSRLRQAYGAAGFFDILVASGGVVDISLYPRAVRKCPGKTLQKFIGTELQQHRLGDHLC